MFRMYVKVQSKCEFNNLVHIFLDKLDLALIKYCSLATTT